MEYGTDKIEMHVGAVQGGERALVIDDLIATGGTLCAAISLLGNIFVLCPPPPFSFSIFANSYLLVLLSISERVGVKVVECACVIELPELKVHFLLNLIVAYQLIAFHGLIKSFNSFLAYPYWFHIQNSFYF